MRVVDRLYGGTSAGSIVSASHPTAGTQAQGFRAWGRRCLSDRLISELDPHLQRLGQTQRLSQTHVSPPRRRQWAGRLPLWAKPSYTLTRRSRLVTYRLRNPAAATAAAPQPSLAGAAILVAARVRGMGLPLRQAAKFPRKRRNRRGRGRGRPPVGSWTGTLESALHWWVVGGAAADERDGFAPGSL